MSKFKLTDEMINKIELDIYDEWQYDEGLCNVGIKGIENEIKEYFNMLCDEYSDGYVYSYAYIDPIDKIVTCIWISVVAGDDIHDKNEMIYISKNKGNKIYKRLINTDKDVSKELKEWIDQYDKED